MSAARQSLGRLGENIAARRLREIGWQLLAANERVAGVRGEIDLVCIDSGDLVIVEVKTRRADSRFGPETPAMAVDRRKQAKLRQLGMTWIRQNREAIPRCRRLRFDVVGIRLDDMGRVVEWQHLRAAF